MKPSSIAIWRMPLSTHPDPLVRQAFREFRKYRPNYQIGAMLEYVTRRVREFRREAALAAQREREVDRAWRLLRKRQRVSLPPAMHY
jgi:hypothetical protein